jgi:hypothetical protein
LVLENRTGEDLSAESRYFSAFDDFDLVFFKDGKELRAYRHSMKYSVVFEKRTHVLKQGKTAGHLRFDVRWPTEDAWEKLEVKLRGTLPECKFKDELLSGAGTIARVKEFDK